MSGQCQACRDRRSISVVIGLRGAASESQSGMSAAGWASASSAAASSSPAEPVKAIVFDEVGGFGHDILWVQSSASSDMSVSATGAASSSQSGMSAAGQASSDSASSPASQSKPSSVRSAVSATMSSVPGSGSSAISVSSLGAASDSQYQACRQRAGLRTSSDAASLHHWRANQGHRWTSSDVTAVPISSMTSSVSSNQLNSPSTSS